MNYTMRWRGCSDLFKLKVRRETRELPAYIRTVDKNGSTIAVARSG
jgi:hypothetical protein